MAKEFTNGFYKTAAWKDCRQAYGRSVGWLCEDCLARGIYRPGQIVHHMIELDPTNITNPEILLSFDNLRLVCRDCHAEQHKKNNKGRRYVVDENGAVIVTE